MTTPTVNNRNGVDTAALFGALDAVKAMPAAARFQFRARNQWIRGTHSQSEIHDFFGLGEEQTHVASHRFDADHPRQLTGSDVGPSPVEYLLHALAACITAGIGNIASARGITLERVASTVTGDIDLQGLLGLDPTVRNGYEGITIHVEIEGDSDDTGLRAVVERSVARSAVFDVLTNGTTVTVDVA